MQSKQSVSVMSGQMATLALVVFGLSLLGTNTQLFSPVSIQARAPPKVPFTATLVDWISSQSENIVEEMEAIVKQQVETYKFSVVLYLRFLDLFHKLKVVAGHDHVAEFGWVAKKVKAYEQIYNSVYQMVTLYLGDLDRKMSIIEANEKKGKQEPVNKVWVQLYETIYYIATHVSMSLSFISWSFSLTGPPRHDQSN